MGLAVVKMCHLDVFKILMILKKKNTFVITLLNYTQKYLNNLFLVVYDNQSQRLQNWVGVGFFGDAIS